MLVSAGLKTDVAALLTLEARYRVGRDRLIGVADVRRAIRVADRSSDVEGLGHRCRPSRPSLALQGSRLRHLGKESADLKNGRSRIERDARRDRRELAGLRISIERALERSSS